MTLSPLRQEKFLQHVQMVEEDKEQVKFKCWAGWASEEKMREELKMKEFLDCFISQYWLI